MPRYRVTQDYSSNANGKHFGPFACDDEVELDQDVAEFVHRDAPGTLEVLEGPPLTGAPEAPASEPDEEKPEDETDERSEDEPPQDRQVRGPRNKRS